jgi:hypothetical protein
VRLRKPSPKEEIRYLEINQRVVTSWGFNDQVHFYHISQILSWLSLACLSGGFAVYVEENGLRHSISSSNNISGAAFWADPNGGDRELLTKLLESFWNEISYLETCRS